jgi:hypothetical protein
MMTHVGGGTCRVRGYLRPFTGGRSGLVVRDYDRATWHDGVDVDAIGVGYLKLSHVESATR